MKHLYNQHINATQSSIKRLFKQPISSISILIMLGMTLALPLTLYLSVQTFENILNKLTVDPSITLFMNNNTTNEDLSSVANTLQDHPDIQSLRYIDKEEALSDTINMLGQTDLAALFEESPLPDAFVIKPKNIEPNSINKLVLELKQLNGINQVMIDSQWVQTLYQIKDFTNKILMFLAIILSFTFILISNNIIRLQILSCRDEIEVSHLLGASHSFIRRPFLYLAFWQGLITSLLGIAMSSAVMVFTFKQMQVILSPYGIEIQQRLFSLPELLWTVLVVVFLAFIGAAWANWQFLREFEQQVG